MVLEVVIAMAQCRLSEVSKPRSRPSVELEDSHSQYLKSRASAQELSSGNVELVIESSILTWR